jgi:8-oxo-dGTP pyrophosphatase MutT (NUDIX family)
MSDLAERLRAALEAGQGTSGRDDYPHEVDRMDAGVLVAITDRAEPGVILTRRHAHLRRHPGQIAFPGGRADAEDASIVETALREAEEEIGLPRARVAIVGVSDSYHTGSGFDITPVLGVVPPDLPLVPHEAEVADVFEVPLRFLLDRGNHARQTMEHEGRMRSYHEIHWGERNIWGATAGMIVNLANRLEGFA